MRKTPDLAKWAHFIYHDLWSRRVKEAPLFGVLQHDWGVIAHFRNNNNTSSLQVTVQSIRAYNWLKHHGFKKITRHFATDIDEALWLMLVTSPRGLSQEES